jgi:hypothetical protein
MLMVDGGGSTHVRRRSNAASAPASTLTSHLPRPAQRSYSTSTSYASANAAEHRMLESTRATAKPKLKPKPDSDGIFSNISNRVRQGITKVQASVKRTVAKLDFERIGSGNSRSSLKPQGSKPRLPHYASANAAEHHMLTSGRSDGTNRRAQSTLRSSIDPELVRAQLHPGISKPKPAHGTAGDLPSARREVQRLSRDFKSLKSSSQSAVSFRSADRLSEAGADLDASRKRLKSAQADKDLKAAQALPLSLGVGREFAIREAQERLSLVRTRYYATQGLDRLGRPIEIPVPEPEPEPEQPKPQESSSLWSRGVSWVKDKGSSALDKADSALDSTKDVVSDGASWAWDHKSDIGHTALDVLGTFDPTPLSDGINAAWYLAEGDKVNAAISAAGMIPYVGDAAKVGKYGAKAYKATKAAKETIDAAGHTRSIARESLIRKPLRDENGRFVRDPNRPPESVSKHRSPEYRSAQAELKRRSLNDPNLPSHARAWLRQEQSRRGNNPRNWRNPPGYHTGHPTWSPPGSGLKLRWELGKDNRFRGAKYGR